MRATCSTAGSLIATGATSGGVAVGSHAVKLRTRGEQPSASVSSLPRLDLSEMIWQLALPR